MLKGLKKVISIALAVTILCSSFVKPVFANDTKLDNKTNFNFISTDFDNVEYTYEEDGSSYKVLESMNESLDHIHTRIYIKVGSEYELLEEYDTTVQKENEDTIKVIKNEAGQVTEEIINIGGFTTNTDSDMVAEADSTLPGVARAGWEFVTFYTGSTYIENFTYSVVVAILVGIVSGGLGLGVVSSAIVGSVAGVIVNERVPSVYFRRWVYYYRDSSGVVTQVKSDNDFYYDSAYNYYIGNATKIWTGKFPW
ncbi:MAG: hypothetical protein H2212_19915 [Ruminococcus sp.]|nr:hypothetical protein [Ruminococcus sp.]